MSQQLEIPLFPPDMMQKIKAAHVLIEMEKLRKELAHEKHVKAGYMGALAKEKKCKTENQDENNRQTNEPA